MAKTQQDHIHKLKRHRYSSGNIIYFCALPDCPYKITPPLALGKRAVCWRCGEPFILSDYAIRLAKPHCENCHKPKTFSPDIETDSNIKILTTTLPLAIEPLSGERTRDTASDLRSRLSSVLTRAAEEEDEI